jgi:natural product precursor
MKKLSKLILNEKVDHLNDHEMKKMKGGTTCYWESYEDWGCTSSAVEAEFMGAVHWCCNNDEAIRNCG